MAKKYSVEEIDELREAIRTKSLFGVYQLKSGVAYCSRDYSESDLINEVEDRVRTHILVGHTAKDLIDSQLRTETAQQRPTSTETNVNEQGTEGDSGTNKAG